MRSTLRLIGGRLVVSLIGGVYVGLRANNVSEGLVVRVVIFLRLKTYRLLSHVVYMEIVLMVIVV